MNYSKNLRRSAMGKRMIATWIIVAVVFSLIGGVSGYVLKTHITAKEQPKEEIQTIEQVQSEFVVYGAYDEDCITQEVSLNWNIGDLSFTPLDIPMDKQLQEFVFYMCDGYNLDFTLIMAVIQHESNFKADAVSKTNDYGLMQINQVNHAQLTEILGVTDFLDPYQNIRAGCFTIRKLFEKYQNTDMVLMAYNMGETGASRLWEAGIFSTKYSESIINIQQQLNKQLEGVTDA